MADEASIAFLRWCLPQLGLRWPGYRRVQGLVGKRLKRRLAELGLADLSAYQAFLTSHPAEWAPLERMCRIPISRFYRDRGVFVCISSRLLPEAASQAAARGDNAVTCWSAGCASGEEPYTLAMAWRFCIAPRWPAVGFTVIASDADATMIKRAEAACYSFSSLKELPQGWRERAFTRRDAVFCLAPEFRQHVRLQLQDIRRSIPDGSFDLILCRNLVFTYFDEALQCRLTGQLYERLLPGGYLVLGSHEALPAGTGDLARLAANLAIYRREPPSGCVS